MEKITHLDGCLHPLTNGRDSIHWMCSHGPFGWSVITSLVGWGDTYLYFLLSFSEIIVMHHFIMSSLGILVCWMMPIFIGVIHWNQTYVIAAKKMWASVLVCITNIKNLMLGRKVSHISNFALRFFNIQCSGMISTSWISFYVNISIFILCIFIYKHIYW